MRPTHKDESLRYDFTQAELLQLGKQIAGEVEAADTCERDKKVFDANIKEEIEKHLGEVARLAPLIRNGYQYRWITCSVAYNDPEPGQKSLYRLDTGELVKTAPMSDAERQEELPMECKPETAEQSSEALFTEPRITETDAPPTGKEAAAGAN